MKETVTTEKVLSVHHWTDRLFSLRVTRPSHLRFHSGEFVMLSLPDNHKLQRAYSIASPAWDDALEFYSIKVEDGPLTSKLKNVGTGDDIVVSVKPTGSLLIDALLPGKRLYMIASGTGFAPFASLLREPALYERFEQIIVTHSCRQVAELGYSQHHIDRLPDDPLVGDIAKARVRFYPSVTREPYVRSARITDLIQNQQLFRELDVPVFQPERDRIMICGSAGLNRDLQKICQDYGLHKGTVSKPGHFVYEKAFVG